MAQDRRHVPARAEPAHPPGVGAGAGRSTIGVCSAGMPGGSGRRLISSTTGSHTDALTAPETIRYVEAFVERIGES